MWREIPSEISPGFIFKNKSGNSPGILSEIYQRIPSHIFSEILSGISPENSSEISSAITVGLFTGFI